MGFQLKKVSDHGTSNPIVARLVLQSDDLLGFSNLSKEQKEEVLVLYHEQVMPRLLTCDTISKRVVERTETIVASIKARGLVTQAQGRVVEVPQVQDLDQDVEQYLYNAKSVLRDAAKILKIFFNEDFQDARYDKVIPWGETKFGPDSEFVRVLREDQDLWMRRLIRMRNAVEHPGGHSGHLHVHNFEATGNTVSTPSWHLNGDPRSGIAHDMPVFVHNMLTFCEELLVFGIRTTGMFPGVAVVEVPETDRVPDCPKRLKVALLNPLPPR
jgi:hypothetical protein